MRRKLAALLAMLMLTSCLSAARATEYEDYEDELREHKIALGMPYPDDGNVSLNGAYLHFGAAKVISLSGLLMVPLRAFLKEYGAEPRYYRDSRVSVWLPGGGELELDSDNFLLTWVRDGKRGSFAVRDSLYVEGGVVYLPAALLGEALGLSMAWDLEYEAVHYTDWTAVTAELDGAFTIANTLLSAQAEKENVGRPRTMGERLAGEYPRRTEAAGGIPPAARLGAEARQARILLGDSAFTTRNIDGITSYTSQADTVRLLVRAIMARGEGGNVLLEHLPPRLPQIAYSLTARMRGNLLLDAKLSGTACPVGGKTERFSVNLLAGEGDLVTNTLAAIPLYKWFPELEAGG